MVVWVRDHELQYKAKIHQSHFPFKGANQGPNEKGLGILHVMCRCANF